MTRMEGNYSFLACRKRGNEVLSDADIWAEERSQSSPKNSSRRSLQFQPQNSSRRSLQFEPERSSRRFLQFEGGESHRSVRSADANASRDRWGIASPF